MNHTEHIFFPFFYPLCRRSDVLYMCFLYMFYGYVYWSLKKSQHYSYVSLTTQECSFQFRFHSIYQIMDELRSRSKLREGDSGVTKHPSRRSPSETCEESIHLNLCWTATHTQCVFCYLINKGLIDRFFFFFFYIFHRCQFKSFSATFPQTSLWCCEDINVLTLLVGCRF